MAFIPWPRFDVNLECLFLPRVYDESFNQLGISLRAIPISGDQKLPGGFPNLAFQRFFPWLPG